MKQHENLWVYLYLTGTDGNAPIRAKFAGTKMIAFTKLSSKPKPLNRVRPKRHIPQTKLLPYTVIENQYSPVANRQSVSVKIKDIAELPSKEQVIAIATAIRRRNRYKYLWVFVYLPGTDTGGMAYSRSEFIGSKLVKYTKISSVTKQSYTASSQNKYGFTATQRKKIYYALAKMQDLFPDDPQWSSDCYQKIADQYDTSKKIVRAIMLEGVKHHWPLPAIPK